MKLLLGDCLDVLKTLPDNSVDSLVTDPPAGIAFMGKEWDKDKGGRDQWVAWFETVMRECFRVMKPGAYGLVWSLPRTSHWPATALENAGFEIRDMVSHVFGSGFPKSLDIGKAIDKAAGAKREVVATVKKTPSAAKCNEGWERPWAKDKTTMDITVPTTDDAKKWEGWGTALKPAHENWILCRKPISEKTVAENVLKWGVGGLNIEGSRIDGKPRTTHSAGNVRTCGNNEYTWGAGTSIKPHADPWPAPSGRFPANFVMSHSEECDKECVEGCPVKTMDDQSLAGGMHSAGNARKANRTDTKSGMFGMEGGEGHRLGDSGGASRFFYCAKPSKKERNAGCESLPIQKVRTGMGGEMPVDDDGKDRDRFSKEAANIHPTVKSIKLMTYLSKMITPPGGTVLDTFMGSGTTGCAAVMNGFDFIGIEREPEYFKICEARIAKASEPVVEEPEDDQPRLFD